ncbi:MAG: S-layer family protein [Oculatellaceae cyanobacterium bins.114]|nr:S-layer family protein [Oculatellaceae cyanobacterium bins.114]
MAQQRLSWLPLLVILGCWGLSSKTVAQVTPDETLGAERSIATSSDSLNFEINGGARRGTNLLHSFRELNVPTRGSVYFVNPSGIETIVSRVTGTTPSNILGVLGVRGTADLFLLNPNGILFGPNGQLDIAGSFVGTTANAVQFGDQGWFSATNPEAPPLLTIAPSALVFTQRASGSIENRSLVGLGIPTGGNVLLVGGDIRFEARGTAFGTDAQVELGGLSEPGTIGLNLGRSPQLQFPVGVRRANITLNNGSGVLLPSQGQSHITLTAENVDLSQSSALALVLSGGTASRTEGDIIINATGNVTLADSSFIANFGLPNFAGNVGETIITGRSLTLTNGAQLNTSTSGQGNAGGVTIRVTEGVTLTGRNAANVPSGIISGVVSPLFQSTSVGRGGDINIQGRSLQLRDGAQITSRTIGAGRGGNIRINASEFFTMTEETTLRTDTFGREAAGDLAITTGRLTLQDGAFIAASTRGIGQGGNLEIAADVITLRGISANGQIRTGLASETLGTGIAGNAGNITLSARQLSIQAGAGISTTTQSRGQGGNIAITADLVDITGQSSNGLVSSSVTSEAQGITDSGRAGDIQISARQVRVRDGGAISTSTSSQGQGGDVAIATQRLSLQGGLISVATVAQGNAGQLRVTATELLELGASGNLSASAGTDSTGQAGGIQLITPHLEVSDRAQITVSSRGSAPAGDLTIRANTVRLNEQANLVAETTSGDGGNIQIQNTEQLLLRRGSRISTTAGTAQTDGNGGNIAIAADLITAVPTEDSDITANAFEGRGGNINITTQSIVGIEFRDRLTPLSDITASSDIGIDGEVLINTPDIDPTQGVVELPTTLVDPSQQIAQNCPTAGVALQELGSFVITGRGGLPANPTELLGSDDVLTTWVTPTNARDESPLAQVSTADVIAPIDMIEVQGWMMDSSGTIHLVANYPNLVQSQQEQLCPGDRSHDHSL